VELTQEVPPSGVWNRDYPRASISDLKSSRTLISDVLTDTSVLVPDSWTSNDQ